MASQNFFAVLPPEEKKKILNLVQRLGEETNEKQKYQRLYEQTQQELQDEKQRFKQLQADHIALKQRLQTSFSVISSVRKNYELAKSNGKAGKHSANQLFFEDQKIRGDQHLPTQLDSGRKMEAVQLRKEIKELADQMKTKESDDLSLVDKIKKCEEIKNRYKIKQTNNQSASKLRDQPQSSKESSLQKQKVVKLEKKIREKKEYKKQEKNSPQAVVREFTSPKKSRQSLSNELYAPDLLDLIDDYVG